VSFKLSLYSLFDFSDRFSFQFDFVTVMQQAVQFGIGDGGFADDGVPVFDWALAGDDGGQRSTKSCKLIRSVKTPQRVWPM
jgi:hypothetical protein